MKVALIGNPNCGKTTLFNALTGAHQKVGNWPGVTIERKSGMMRKSDIEIVDLPGIYSLSPYTAEETVSRQFLLEGAPDLVVNIIDATAIERSLYLTTQVMELDCPVLLALNMEDLLKRKGTVIDAEKLSTLLGIPVVSISALKKTGLSELADAIKAAPTQTARPTMFSGALEQAVQTIARTVPQKNARFLAVKYLERDPAFIAVRADTVEAETLRVEAAEGKEIEQVVANARYGFIDELKPQFMTQAPKKRTVSEKLDRVFLNKYATLPIFAVIMFGVYFLSVGLVGSATVDLVGGGVEWLGEAFGGWLGSVGASAWAISLIIDGILAGVGAVLGFVPQLIILFLCLSLLEATGYMSRISFFLDRLFRRFGLSGKSLIPFIIGTGCSVPAIMSSRTVENEDEKKMTVFLTPFVPCSAKLPIITLFAGYFFGAGSALVSASMYFLAIAVIIILAAVMKKVLFKHKTSAYLAELPEYKAPSVRYVARDVAQKTGAFIARAGSVILLCSVAIWFLLSFSWKFEYGIDPDASILASLGNAIAWFFYPMLGEWSWAASVSAIQGLVAKEQVVSSMAVINGLADSVAEGGLIFAEGGVFGFFNAASAYAFLVFNLFSAPCFGAIGAMRRELGGTKRMFLAVGVQTLIAWVLACVSFGIGSLILMI